MTIDNILAIGALITALVAILKSRVDVAKISSEVYTDVIKTMRLEMERLEQEIDEKDTRIQQLQKDYEMQGEIVEKLTQRIKALEGERTKLLADMRKLRRDTAPLKK